MSGSSHVNSNFFSWINFLVRNTCWKWFLLFLASPCPCGQWFNQTWICTMSRNFHANLNFFSQMDLGKNTFNWSTFANLSLFPLWRGHGTSFEQIWMTFTQEWFEPSSNEIEKLRQVLKMIFKNVLCIYSSVIISPWRKVFPFMKELNPFPQG
jgi:hypothetical protein